MIEVAFAIPELGYGGPDAVFRTLLRHLDRDRFRPSVIIKEGGATGDAEGTIVDEVGTGRYPVLSTHRVLSDRKPDIVLSTLRMNVTCAAVQPPGPGKGPAHVARIANNLTRQVLELTTMRSRARLLAIESSYALAVGRSNAVVAQTEVMHRDIANRYGGAAARKTKVIHNPVDVVRLAELADSPGPSFDHDGPVIVSVGRLAAQKGYDLLLSSLRDVVDVHKDAHLLLLGEGPDEEALVARAGRLGLTDNVTFLGQVDNPFPIVSRADLFVSSSRYEGFSNALAEAQALGVPAVAVGGDATGDAIVTPESGIVLPSPEPTTMATAIVSILDEPGRFDPDKITASICDRFDPLVITAQYEELLATTLESHVNGSTAEPGAPAHIRPRLKSLAAPILRSRRPRATTRRRRPVTIDASGRWAE